MSKEIRVFDPETDKVNCNLCGKLMKIDYYNSHYDRCLDIQYLISIAKKQGKIIPREDLESAKPEIISQLLKKYEPPKQEGLII